MLLLMSIFFILSDTCIKDGNEYAAFFGTKAITLNNKKQEPYLGVKSSTDTTVTHSIYKEKGLVIDLYHKISTNENDYFIVNGKKIKFLRSASKANANLLIDKAIGTFNLESCSSYTTQTVKGRQYFIFNGEVQGAAGSMASLQLFFVVDYTDKKDLKFYHLQSWAPIEFSFFDFNNDGYLDFSFFKDLISTKNVEIKNCSLSNFQVLQVKHKSKWQAVWEETCLRIKN
jgi:hypothetical protein